MIFQLDGHMGPFTAGLFFSAGFSVFIAVFIQRWRETPGIHWLTVQLLAQTIWSLSVAMEILAPDLPVKIFFHKVSRIGVLGVPLSWMFFVFYYTNQARWLSRRLSRILYGVVAFLLVMAFTNELHGWFWSSVELRSGGIGAVYGRGPLYWVAAGLSFSMLLSALVDLAWMGLRSPSVYRNQAVLLVMAALAPGLSSIAFVLGLTGENDYTPYAFLLTSAGAAWSVLRFRFYNMLPVARKRLLEMLPDGIMAVDAQKRLIDINPAFLRIAGFPSPTLGQPVDQLLAESQLGMDGLDSHLAPQRRVITDQANGNFYDLSVSELEIRPGLPNGRLIILRDVTAVERSAQAHRRSDENIRRIFDANPFPVAIVSKEQAVIYQVNQAALDYFHVARDEMIGRRISSFYTQAGLHAEIIAEIEREGSLKNKLVEVKHPGGKRTHVVMSIFPVEYYGDQRWLLTFADITERRQMEENERAQRVLGEVVLDVSAMLTSTLNFDEVLDRILDNVSRLVQYEGVCFVQVAQGVGLTVRARGFLEHGHTSPLEKISLNVETTADLRWMVEHRAPFFSADVKLDPDWITFPGMEWVHSYLSAPIFTSGQIAGFISLFHSLKGFYNQADAARLQIFSAQAGIALQNARLYSEIQAAARESAMLQEIAFIVGSSLDFDLVIDKVFDRIAGLISCDSIGVELLDGEEFMLRAFRDSGEPVANQGAHWKVQGSPNELVLRERRVLHFPDVQARFVEYRKPPVNKIRSLLMAPLISGGDVIGFISFDSWLLNHFTQKDERIANAIAPSIAVALENSLLYEETQRRLKNQSILNEISRAVSKMLDPDEILDLIWQQVSRFIDASDFLVAIKNAAHDSFIVRYKRQAGQMQPVDAFEAHHGMQYILQSRRALFLRSRVEVEEFEKTTGLNLLDAKRCLMIVPMQVSGALVGMLEIFHTSRDYAYSRDDFELFSSIAAQTAVFLENSRLFDETRRRAEEMEILNQIGLAITTGLDRERVLLTLFDQCRLIMPVDCFYVALYDSETDRVEYPLFFDQGYYRDVASYKLSDRPGLAGAVLRGRRAVYFSDLSELRQNQQYQPLWLGKDNTRSFLGAPLILRDHPIGVIALQSVMQDAYTQDHLHLLELISLQAAIAIENTRLYAEAQRMATTDFLTGMLNRRELFVRAGIEFGRSVRYGRVMSVLMIDIDHFKQVNDQYGHLAGDQVLRSLSLVCQMNVRQVDVLGRYGGEEILVLMPETDFPSAYAVAERLRFAISEMSVDAQDASIRITVSIGVACLTDPNGMSLEKLISQADSALFLAKSSGRNCVRSSPGAGI